MERMLRIYPAYFDVTNPEFEHAIFGLNVSDHDIKLGYNSKFYTIKPGQIFETDDPVANILLPQGYSYDFVEIKNASGRSTAGEKVNEQQALAFFPTYEEAEQHYRELKPAKPAPKKYTADGIAKLGAPTLRTIIDNLGIEQPPEDTDNSQLRAYILAEQGE